MYFLISKAVWAITAPTTLLLLLTASGVLLLGLGWRRTGLWLAAGGIGLVLLAGFLPVGEVLARVLENRFPVCTEPERVDGVIVLGGAVDPVTMRDRRQLTLNDAGERMIAMADIARRHPDWRVVFTGGSAVMFGSKVGEAEALAPYLVQLGIPEGRILLEGRSRNTFENALYTADLLKPQPGQTFVLVTSAQHMPRSVGIFRKTGFDVIPCPVDFTTAPTTTSSLPGVSLSDNLMRVDRAFREFMGLGAAWVFGQSDELFPAPRP